MQDLIVVEYLVTPHQLAEEVIDLLFTQPALVNQVEESPSVAVLHKDIYIVLRLDLNFLYPHKIGVTGQLLHNIELLKGQLLLLNLLDVDYLDGV